MDRQLIYPGQIPLETDLLNTNKNTMVALAKIAAAMLGTTTQVNGLSVVPTGPASLQVYVNSGEIYSLQNIDNTAYSSIAADTTRTILKQGISLNQVTLSCPAPGTGGQSINYLIEASYQDTDALPVVLPYYNASNPSTAYSGPANAGTTNNTVRQGLISLIAKAGVAATTGSQTTPAVDSGYTALYVVTVSNGQTQINAGNIVAVTNAPFISPAAQLNLANVFTQIQSAVTPAQFDNSTKLATTSFIQQAIGNLSTTIAPNITTTLTAANAGSLISFGGAGGYTVTMPVSSSVASGTSMLIQNLSSASITISRQSSDSLVNGTVTSNTFSLGVGDFALATRSGTNWFFNGSSTLPNTAAFGSSVAANGYQKLPSGLIIQWGQCGSILANSNAVITFPIAFPSAAYAVSTCNAYSGSSSTIQAAVGITLSSPTGMTVYNSGTAAQNGPSYIVIGK